MKNLFNIFYSLCFSMVIFEQNSLCSEGKTSPSTIRSESKTPPNGKEKTPPKIVRAPWASFVEKKLVRRRSSDRPMTPEDHLQQKSANLVYRTLSFRKLNVKSPDKNHEKAWEAERALAYEEMVPKYMKMHRLMLPTSPLNGDNKADELKKQAQLELEMHECDLFDEKTERAIEELNDAIAGDEAELDPRRRWCVIL